MSDAPVLLKNRLFFLEFIKILCVFFVFFFHCTRVFDAERWHIKDPHPTSFSSFYLYEIGMAVMPMFFFVSGASIWFSLQKRSGSRMMKNVLKRFLFPLIFGCTVLAIPVVYVERVYTGAYEGSLFSFVPHYFNGWYGFGGNFVWHGLHLWYMIMLFGFTILLLPFFVWGKTLLQKPIIQKLTNSPLLFLFFALLMIIPGWKLHPDGWWGGRWWGGWNFIDNLIFFGGGYLFFSNPALLQKTQKIKWFALTLAVCLTTLSIYWHDHLPTPPFRSSFFITKVIVRSLACWAWICAVVGLASQYVATGNQKLIYGSNAVMPFYILNQPIIVILAFFIVQWQLSIPLKFLMISVSSFTLTLLVYELVKRVTFLRWLFGIPEKKKVKEVDQLLSTIKMNTKINSSKDVSF